MAGIKQHACWVWDGDGGGLQRLWKKGSAGVPDAILRQVHLAISLSAISHRSRSPPP